MADQISRVDYYSAIVPDKPGEAARILTALEQAGINLVAFSGFPEGRKSHLDFVAGVEISAKQVERAAEALGKCIQFLNRDALLSRCLPR